MIVLGIDLGTSAIKLSLIDQTLQQVASASAPVASKFPFDGASEQEATDWWDALLVAVETLAANAPRHWASVKAIGLSGQMHGAVMLGADDVPVAPVILWNDGRAAPQCAEFEERLPAITDIASIRPLAGFTAPKLMWMKEHRPDLHAQIRSVMLPKDYLGLRLHGQKVTDPSDAAGTHWFDQSARKWSEEACLASDTDPAWLPRIVSGSDIAGHLLAAPAKALGLPAGLPVAAGGGDAATGAVGIGAVREGRSFISLGTSGQIFVATDSYRPNPLGMIHAYAHTVPDTWFQMAAMLNGASPMAWFAGVCKADIGVLLEEAAAAEEARTPDALPYLTGERTPHGDSAIRAAFYGMDAATTRGEMMRAVVRAISFSFADAAEALAVGGTQLQSPLAIGGGAKSNLLMQMIADGLQVEIRRVAGAGTGPAVGAARLAAVANGLASAGDLDCSPQVERVFEPGREYAGLRTTALRRYRALYTSMSALNATGTEKSPDP
ncbi:MAG: xylulokinase [Alphaproteobacteria bacterium]|nr:xylulokinase [Alphaproteobacteria bacterium]NNF70739.1 xylulokinase [Paracoccaceae bacterium]